MQPSKTLHNGEDKRKFVLDFETYYEDKTGPDKEDRCSVTKLGNVKYTEHPRYSCYLVSIVEVSSPYEPEEPLSWVGAPEDAPWEEINGHHWFAHNAGFDMAVFEGCRRDGLCPKEVEPVRWDDTSAMAVYFKLPRYLGGAVKEALGIHLSKGIRTKADGKTPQDMKDEGWWEDMVKYGHEDSVYAAQLVEKMFPQWPQVERDVAILTCIRSNHGLTLDIPLLKGGIKKLEDAVWEAENAIPWCPEKRPVSPKALAEECRENGILPPKSMDKTKPYIEPWLEEYGKQFPWVNAMQRWRSANSLLTKLRKYENRIGANGRMSYGFKYGAAHTMRWGGDAGTNVQALHKDVVEGVDHRSMIIASPGKKLAIWDYDQIEARILLYIAGDEEQLDLIRQGLSPYESHAVKTMNYDPSLGKLKLVNPEMYALAKARVLGLGYQCGIGAFVSVARVMAGLNISTTEAKKIVNDFRASNRGIVKLWNRLDKDLQIAAVRKQNYELELPSGRIMTYYNPIKRGRGVMVQLERGAAHRSIYGGRATENLVQGIGRDVLVDGLIRLHDNGYPWLFHVHDEGINEVPEDTTAEELNSLICQTPEWLEGCPIGASVEFSQHYLKG